MRKINDLVAEADRTVVRRLTQTGLTNAERLCLHRVRAIIDYGAARQHAVPAGPLEKMAQYCLRLEEQYQNEVRPGNLLRWLTTSQTKTDPRQAFRDILKEYPNIRRDACKKFDQWAKMVDRAVRTARRARRARTLESGDPPHSSAP